jgi:TonB family protein
MAEGAFRALVIHEVVPEYPADALRTELSGVSVAEVDVGTSGDVLRIHVLQAPGDSVGDAMTRALTKWKFRVPTVKGVPLGVAGKITYYFLIENRKGRVLAPSQMPTAHEDSIK